MNPQAACLASQCPHGKKFLNMLQRCMDLYTVRKLKSKIDAFGGSGAAETKGRHAKSLDEMRLPM